MKKRIFLFLLLILGIITIVSAQNRPLPRDWRPNAPSPAPRVNREEVKVSGELTIVQGFLAVKSGDVTYLAMGLQRYIGFIDSLKDGARVTLEGYAFNRPQNEKTKLLLISKLTIGGKDYDLGRQWMKQPQQLQNPRQVLPPQPAPRQPAPRQPPPPEMPQRRQQMPFNRGRTL